MDPEAVCRMNDATSVTYLVLRVFSKKEVSMNVTTKFQFGFNFREKKENAGFEVIRC